MSIYDIEVKDINMNSIKMEEFKGKTLLIVNVASACGFTPQYTGLQNLYDKYKDKNFIVIGFPANNFMWQEPGTNKEIAEFCQENYGVSFPMMGKISVIGLNQHPIYSFLTRKKLNGYVDAIVTWNFQKFLIDENGYVVKSISPRRKPDDQEVLNWINGS